MEKSLRVIDFYMYPGPTSFFLVMIWRAGTLFSLLMARLLAVRGFDAIQVSPR
jgi:hypothetical protein